MAISVKTKIIKNMKSVVHLGLFLTVLFMSLFPDMKAQVVSKWRFKGDFSEGLAPVEDYNEMWGYIDKKGQLVIPCVWYSTGAFSEGLGPVMNDEGLCGFINKAGEVVIPCQWNGASDFRDHLVRVIDDEGKCGFECTGQEDTGCRRN